MRLKREEILRRLAFRYKVPRSWQRQDAMRLWASNSDTITDKELFEYQTDYRCQVCGVVTQDIRHIGIECFYELHEVSEKFRIIEDSRDGHTIRVYLLKVCKGCRSLFMFHYLADFVDNGGRIRKEQDIDEDGIKELKIEVV